MRNLSIARRLMVNLAASIAITLGAALGLSYLLKVSSTSSTNLAATAPAKNQASFELLDVIVKLQASTQKMVQEQDPDAIEALMHQSEAGMAVQLRTLVGQFKIGSAAPGQQVSANA
jgi:hypothetical protein